jgi:hypothetical protein
MAVIIRFVISIQPHGCIFGAQKAFNCMSLEAVKGAATREKQNLKQARILHSQCSQDNTGRNRPCGAARMDERARIEANWAALLRHLPMHHYKCGVYSWDTTTFNVKNHVKSSCFNDFLQFVVFPPLLLI